MKQGLIGLLALLMVGSAWELGNGSGGGGGGLSGLSPSPSLLGSSSKLKALAKKAAAKREKSDRDEKRPAQKSAEAKPSALAGLMDSKGGDDAPLAAAKGDKAMEASHLAGLAKGPAADKIGALLADKPALAGKLAAAMAAAPSEGKGGVADGEAMAAAPSEGEAGAADGEAMAAAPSKGEARAVGKRPPRATGRVTGSQLSVVGRVDKAIVERSLRMYKSGFLFCYKMELGRTPNLKGTIQTQFRIRKGRVQSVVIRNSTLGNKRVEKCVSSRLKRLRFPKARRGSAVVKYTFKFSPN